MSSVLLTELERIHSVKITHAGFAIFLSCLISTLRICLCVLCRNTISIFTIGLALGARNFWSGNASTFISENSVFLLILACIDFSMLFAFLSEKVCNLLCV